MKLLVDMNLSPRWIAFLLDAGYEAAHWSALGKADATDSEIMAFAAANDYVVLTNDLDFAAILASTHHKKPSVVQIRAEDLDPNVIGTRIVAALQYDELSNLVDKLSLLLISQSLYSRYAANNCFNILPSQKICIDYLHVATREVTTNFRCSQV